MQPFNFPEANVPAVQKPDGWKDEDCSPIAAWFGSNTLSTGEEIPQVITAWHPTPEELKLLNEGGPVYLFLTANGLPPHFLTAHNPFEPQPIILDGSIDVNELEKRVKKESNHIQEIDGSETDYKDDPIVVGNGYVEGFEPNQLTDENINDFKNY